MSKIIEVKNLSKKFKIQNNEIEIFKNLNFSLTQGECLGLIGKNGSGKSTLLKILAGIYEPTSGDVINEVEAYPLIELGAAIDQELTGIENIFLTAEIYAVKKETVLKKIKDIISFADIGNYINYKVKFYSSGMLLRLAFANILLIDPKLIFIDEALGVGDFFFQQKCLNLIHKLKKKGVSFIIVSHDMGLIGSLANKILLVEPEICKIYDVNTGIDIFFNSSVIKNFTNNKNYLENIKILYEEEKFIVGSNLNVILIVNNESNLISNISFTIFDKYEKILSNSSTMLKNISLDKIKKPKLKFKINFPFEEGQYSIAFSFLSIDKSNKHKVIQNTDQILLKPLVNRNLVIRDFYGKYGVNWNVILDAEKN
jgi:ABC-type polysaccharide/polyol phosphate transport system ATPase subunit